MTQGMAEAEHLSDRRETPDIGATRGSRVQQLRVRENGKDIYKVDINC